MAIYKPSLLDKFKDFVNGLKANWDDYEQHKADYETHKADYETHKAEYEAHVADFEAHLDQYEAHVADFEAHKADKTPHDVPRASVYHSLNQSIPNGTWTTLSFDSEHFDSENIHDPSVDATKLICKTAGTYLIIGFVYFAANDAGVRSARLLRNGNKANEVVINAPFNAYAGVLTSWVTNLSVNDYIQMQAYQTSGGALTVGSSLSMVKVG